MEDASRYNDDAVIIYNPLTFAQENFNCRRVLSPRFNFDTRYYTTVRVRSTLYCLKINQKPSRLIHLVNLMPEQEGKRILSMEKAKPKTTRTYTSIVNFKCKFLFVIGGCTIERSEN